MSGKTLDTLVKDIYGLFEEHHEVSSDHVKGFADTLANIIHSRMNEVQGLGRLRPSNLGQPCDRKLWYTVNTPEKAEPLSPKVRFKFLYGDILEALVLFLAKEAGHDVTGEQDKVEIEGIVGSRDAVIDGVLVDVKSANSRSYSKFRDNTIKKDDPFGYITQLMFYLEASDDVRRRDMAAFLAVDKELGNLCITKVPNEQIDFQKLIEQKRGAVSSSSPPSRGYEDKPDGKSGNRQLDTACKYCPFKQECWPELRTFIYSNGPRFLTKVVRTPDVPEVSDAQATS